MQFHDVQKDVKEFHQKFGMGTANKVTPLSDEVRDFRIDRIKEEATELIQALESGDPVAIASETVDLIYIALGTLVLMGIPFLSCWKAVHDANMKKQRVTTGNTKSTKPVKPKGWRSPVEEVKRILGRVGYVPLAQPVDEGAPDPEEQADKADGPVEEIEASEKGS